MVNKQNSELSEVENTNSELEEIEEVEPIETSPEAEVKKAKVAHKKSHYSVLDIVEIASVVGSVGAAVATVITQQLAYASVPLSIAVALNVVNRKQYIDAVNRQQESAIAQLQSVIDNESSTSEIAFNSVHDHLAQLQQVDQELRKGTLDLRDYAQSLNSAQGKVLKLVNALREIELWTSMIRGNPNSGDAYYNRGLIYQRLNDKEAAIFDYSQAIQQNFHDPHVYQNRGILRGAIGDKQGAVEDLRHATKLFF